MPDVFLLLIILLPVILFIAVDEFKESTDFNYSITFITGFALLIALQVFLAEYKITLGWWLGASFWVFALVIAVRKSASVLMRGGSKFFQHVFVSVSLVVSAFAVWLYPYFRFPSIRKGAPFSNGNNDLAIYVVSGDNFLHAGFKEFGRVVSYQAGALTNFEVAGSSSLVATVSRFTQQAVWRSTSLSMLLIIGLTTIGIYVLLRRWSMPILIALPAAVWAMSSSYARLPQQNYFLSQTISRLALVSVLIGIDRIVRAHDRREQDQGVVIITIATWLSLISYPAGSISSGAVVIGVLGAYFLSSRLSKTSEIIPVRKLLLVPLSFTLAIPLVLGRWNLIADNVSLYSKENVSGWPAPTSSVSAWIGVSPFLTSWISMMTTLVIVAILVFCLSQLRRSSAQETYLALFVVLSIAVAHLMLATRLGSDAYQVWKFLATVQPIALCGLLVFVVSSLRQQNLIDGKHLPHALAVCLVGLLGINTVRSTDTYRSSIQFPSMELEVAAKNPIVRSPNLLIRLDPYLETMIAPVILNLRDAFYASETYLGPELPKDTRCTISHIKNATSVEVAKGLFVGPIEACD
jgi:hypothetical protein